MPSVRNLPFAEIVVSFFLVGFKGCRYHWKDNHSCVFARLRKWKLWSASEQLSGRVPGDCGAVGDTIWAYVVGPNMSRLLLHFYSRLSSECIPVQIA